VRIILREYAETPRKPRSDRGIAEVGSMCDRFERECRKRGIRITTQRLAVYKALARDAGHPTADALYARVRSGVRGLSLATVYRILDSLERDGFIRRVSTTDGAGRYDANLEFHQHLVCRICGRIMDSQVEGLRSLSLSGSGPGGFVPETLDVRIVGKCGSCRRPRGRKTKLN
jgi:Fur family peroxide stress response transcriptional regulator